MVCGTLRGVSAVWRPWELKDGIRGMFPPVHDDEDDAEHDLTEKAGQRKVRKQVTCDEDNSICAGHKQARADRML